MELGVMVIFVFASFLVIISGVAVKYFKAYWLISGYNTMSEEKKKNVDVASLGNFIGNFCFVLAGIMLLGGFLISVGKGIIGLMIFALIVPVSIYSIINAQKYDGNTRNADGNMNTKTKIIVGSISVMLVGVLITAGVLVNESNKPTEVIINNGYLEIHGLYGESVNIKDIKELSLKDAMPEIKYKSNGSSLGSKKKGNFELNEIGSAKLFVNDSQPPFIFVRTNSKLFILNYENPEQTKELYNTLIAEWR